MTDVPVVLLAVLAVAALLVAALLSAGEAAVVRVSRTAVAELEAHRHASAARVRQLGHDAGEVAASAAFVRLLCEMVAAVCLTLIVSSGSLSWGWVLVVATAACVLVTFVLARVSPRSLGHRHPVVVVVVLSRLLVAVHVVVGRLVRAAPSVGDLDEEELRQIVERVSESEVIEDDEREMVRSVLGLGDTLTREVMVPRTDMITTSESTPLPKVLSLLLRSGYSRVPVIGEQVDDLRGVIYLKDLVRRLQDDPEAATVPAGAVIRPAVFVPESKPVDDLLREMQAGSSHIAMVVDEYGGIAGLVTIEDALEEIVGELTDEHDPSAPVVEDLGDGVFRVPARLGKDELGELFDLEVEDDDVDTAGGLLAKALGKVPIPGSAADSHGLHLVAEQAEGRRKRIATILVSRADQRTPQDDDAEAGPAGTTDSTHTPSTEAHS